jgi:hypothetical protein
MGTATLMRTEVGRCIRYRRLPVTLLGWRQQSYLKYCFAWARNVLDWFVQEDLLEQIYKWEFLLSRRHLRHSISNHGDLLRLHLALRKLIQGTAFSSLATSLVYDALYHALMRIMSLDVEEKLRHTLYRKT